MRPFKITVATAATALVVLLAGCSGDSEEPTTEAAATSEEERLADLAASAAAVTFESVLHLAWEKDAGLNEMNPVALCLEAQELGLDRISGRWSHLDLWTDEGVEFDPAVFESYVTAECAELGFDVG